MSFVIYWEKTTDERGFVSYGNLVGKVIKEYEPVDFHKATKYGTKREAQRTADWYLRRGGFGLFLVMKV